MGGGCLEDKKTAYGYNANGQLIYTSYCETDAVSYTHLTLPTTPYV